VRYVPNILSLARLVLTIPVIVLILINTPQAYLAATVLYFFTAVSDTVDGRIARRYNLVTRLGAFLDCGGQGLRLFDLDRWCRWAVYRLDRHRDRRAQFVVSGLRRWRRRMASSPCRALGQAERF
jgi:hypothetical protein